MTIPSQGVPEGGEALKPCPFCDNEAWIDGVHTGRKITHYVVVCSNCHVTGPGEWPTEARAIKAWNRRAGPSVSQPLPEAAPQPKACECGHAKHQRLCVHRDHSGRHDCDCVAGVSGETAAPAPSSVSIDPSISEHVAKPPRQATISVSDSASPAGLNVEVHVAAAPATPTTGHICRRSGLPMEFWRVGPCPGCQADARSPSEDSDARCPIGPYAANECEHCIRGVDATMPPSFDTLLAVGLAGRRLSKGDQLPWSFQFHGLPVTHENDNCYLITAPTGTVRVERAHPAGEGAPTDGAEVEADPQAFEWRLRQMYPDPKFADTDTGFTTDAEMARFAMENARIAQEQLDRANALKAEADKLYSPSIQRTIIKLGRAVVALRYRLIASRHYTVEKLQVALSESRAERDELRGAFLKLREEARPLIAYHVDGDSECQFDHHGNCQAHGWSTSPDIRCLNEHALRVLSLLDRATTKEANG
jgi:Lar family restriction alleviation protein